MSDVVPVRNALISVSDKMGLADFAAGLSAAGVTIYSTGGTRAHLEQSGIKVEDVAEYTGFPEMLDGRVKTLHPRIFAGILARRDLDDHMDTIADHDIEPFDLVVVNLYPFAATVSRSGATRAECIEQIDIGGPSLVRAAAKNHGDVAIATSPEQYGDVLDQLETLGGTTDELRTQLAAEAFDHTAGYDRAIADYMQGDAVGGEFPASMHVSLRRKTQLRYGENPHQRAALYSDSSIDPRTWCRLVRSVAKSCLTTTCWTSMPLSTSLAVLPNQRSLSSSTTTPVVLQPVTLFPKRSTKPWLVTRCQPLVPSLA